MGNSFGKIFKLTSFGESHGKAIGGVIDGCPSGIDFNIQHIQSKLNKRKPGQSEITSPREEKDIIEILSGIHNNKTLGTPIGFIVRNDSFDSSPYFENKNFFRPSHADFSYFRKYKNVDIRGGGRSSARETISRVVAGSIADLILMKMKIEVFSYVSKIYNFSCDLKYFEVDKKNIYNNDFRFPNQSKLKDLKKFIKKIKKEGNTVGGEIKTVIKGLEAGIGEPVFDKLSANLAKAIMSINAVKSFKIGFENADISESYGSDVNDELINLDGKTKTNFSGGIQGGISNGNDIIFTTAFKPVSSIKIEQMTINKNGEKKNISIFGHHDPCIVPRAVPIVESMASMVILDQIFINQSNKFNNL